MASFPRRDEVETDKPPTNSRQVVLDGRRATGTGRSPPPQNTTPLAKGPGEKVSNSFPPQGEFFILFLLITTFLDGHCSFQLACLPFL